MDSLQVCYVCFLSGYVCCQPVLCTLVVLGAYLVLTAARELELDGFPLGRLCVLALGHAIPPAVAVSEVRGVCCVYVGAVL